MRYITVAASALALVITAGPATASPRQADLEHVRPPAVARELPPGELAAVVARVRNAGGRKARPTTLRLYLSRDARLGKGDRRLPGRWHVHKLRPRRVAKVRLGVWIAETTKPGRYHLFVCADDKRVVRERDERNNCVSRKVRITGPAPLLGSATTVGAPLATTDPAPATEPPQAVTCVASATPESPDLPDDGFADTNCDGIDGDADRAIFVSASGSDSDPGTRSRPKQTILQGINAAATEGKDVYIAQGTYPERINLHDGVSLYGGFLADWSRAEAADVRVSGARNAVGHTEAVHAEQIAARTVLADLTLAPATPAGSGASSYGVFAVEAPGLVLDGVTISAAPGQAALEPRADGQPGADGRAGQTPGAVCNSWGGGGGAGNPVPRRKRRGRRYHLRIGDRRLRHRRSRARRRPRRLRGCCQQRRGGSRSRRRHRPERPPRIGWRRRQDAERRLAH